MPLNWFLDKQDAEVRDLVKKSPDKRVAEAVLAVLGNQSATDSIRRMRANPVFQVSILDSGRALRDIVGIYNRINTAGKRVESEERAFANVVAEYDGVDKELEAFFAAVHGSHKGRDDLLSRRKENRFGFELFMRAFVIGLAYHTDRSVGSSTFAFESANPETLSRAAQKLPDIAKATVTVLKDVSEIIKVKLYCDDLRMLPETASLWPLIQLLIRFPILVQHSEGALASIALRLILADMNKRDLLQLCDELTSVKNASEGLALFDKHEHLAPKRIARAVRKEIDSTRSLMATQALILYWVLRRAGAKDFKYDKNPVRDIARLRRKYSVEPDLSDAVSPEKQHIVRHRRLKELFGLTDSRRVGRHEVNDLGNLTYISAALNSFTIGVGSKSLLIDKEPSNNLIAHLLGQDTALLRLFADACSGARKKTAKRSFQKFCSIPAASSRTAS